MVTTTIRFIIDNADTLRHNLPYAISATNESPGRAHGFPGPGPGAHAPGPRDFLVALMAKGKFWRRVSALSKVRGAGGLSNETTIR